MRKLGYVICLVLAIFGMSIFNEAKAQDQEFTIQVSTFARQAKFIDDNETLSFKIKEGEDEIAPENIDIKQIKQTVIAIDNSKSMKYILGGLTRHLEKSLPDTIVSPTMVVTFNEDVEILSNFTTSKSDLVQSLKKVQLAQKNTKLFKVIETLKKFAGNKLTHIILVTDGADTEGEVINIKELLSSTNLTISYVNWGYGDPSLVVDEPGYEPNGKSRIIELKPNALLSTIAERSGGDVVNLTKWKGLHNYLDKKLKSGTFLYSLFWHTDNPVKKVYFQNFPFASMGIIKEQKKK